MTKKISSQFTGPSKGLTIINGLAFAYSGGVEVDNSKEFELLAFNTGSKPIDAILTPTYSSPSGTATGDDYIFRVYINGNLVSNNYLSFDYHLVIAANLYYFVIPPLSYVEIKAKNMSDSSANTCFATIRGKVHDN